MSHWNYRILHDENRYFVAEVHYGADGKPNSWAEKHNLLDVDDFEELEFAIKHIDETLSKPVLEIRDGRIAGVDTGEFGLAEAQ